MSLPRRYYPSLAALRALEAVDRLGSATAAAEELSQTQSAVSRQLAALEEQLGAALFVRKNRRLVLTPGASAYAVEVREALAQIAQAGVKLTLNPTGGTLNLAILPTFGMRWLVPRLPDFARRHPEVTVNLSTRIEKFSFASEPFDAAIQFGFGVWADCDYLRLRPEAVIPVGAPELLASHSPINVARDVMGLPLLHIASRPDGWRDWFAAQGVEADSLSGTVHDQYSTIMQAALHGLGLGLLPDYLAEPDIATGRLKRVWGGPVEAKGAYHLVWPHSKSQDPALKVFREWLTGQAETEEDPLPR